MPTPKLPTDKAKLAQMVRNNQPSFERDAEKHAQHRDQSDGSSLLSGQSWLDQLYGTPTGVDAHMRATEKAMKKSDGSHTPLDLKKLGEKHDLQDLAKARQQFQWWRNEEERARAELKREEQEKRQKEMEEQERKRMEDEHARQAAYSGDNEAHGKAKARLGAPRRKATTEQHPETKMGGTK